jgi:outer membrane lipoprotein SlyB
MDIKPSSSSTQVNEAKPTARRLELLDHATAVTSSSSVGAAIGSIAGAAVGLVLGVTFLPFGAAIAGAVAAGAIAELRYRRGQPSVQADKREADGT